MTVELAVGLGAVALIGVIGLGLWMRTLSRKLTAVPASGNLFEAVRRLDEDLSAAEKAIGQLQPAVRSLLDRMPGAVRHMAVVAYDAHGDMAGRLSRSVALLNEKGDGLVYTLLTGRTESTFFTKMVRGGRGSEALSPEEQTAVDRALQR
jgi:hypothetical protein